MKESRPGTYSGMRGRIQGVPGPGSTSGVMRSNASTACRKISICSMT